MRTAGEVNMDRSGRSPRRSSRTQLRTLQPNSCPSISEKAVSTTQYATLRFFSLVAHSMNSRATAVRVSRLSRQTGGPQAKKNLPRAR